MAVTALTVSVSEERSLLGRAQLLTQWVCMNDPDVI